VDHENLVLYGQWAEIKSLEAVGDTENPRYMELLYGLVSFLRDQMPT
jgi:hypothetical protein